MRKNLFLLITTLVITTVTINSLNAQGTLIHYWHFNNYTLGAMHTYPVDTIHSIAADYSIHDTSKARILYSEIPGTSSVYSTYIDTVVGDVSDTVNVRMSTASGYALRARNPSDSMQLLFYIPTVHYNNILLTYGSQSSSTSHGQLHQNFDYSVDSGLTWRTSGLSITSDSAWLIFHRTSISFTTDTMVNNNSKLVFRIKFTGNTSGTSGNNRFDNITVDGDSIIAPHISITATPGTTICAGTSIHFLATAIYGGSVSPSYQWKKNGVVVGTDSTGLYTSALATGDTIICYLHNGVGGSVIATSNYFVITVNPLPVAGTITGSSLVCTTLRDTLLETATGGTWSATNSDATVSSTGIVLGVSSGIDTIKYTVTNSCGTAVAIKIITVNTLVTGTAISGATNVCQAANTTLSDITTGGTWSAVNTHASVSGSGVVTGISGGVDTISYLISSTCALSTMAITINPLPDSGSISGAAGICIGGHDTLSETVSGGVWSSSNTAIATVTLGGIVDGVTVGVDTIYYATTNACGTTRAKKVITVTLTASASTISGLSVVCEGATIRLSDSTAGGVWSITNTSASISDSGIVTGITRGLDTVKYSVTFTCGTVVITAPITVNPLPHAGVINGSTSVCMGTTLNLTDTTSGGSWTELTGHSSVALGIVTPVSTGVDTILYSVTNSCGTARDSFAISINTVPTIAAITGVDSVCPGATITLSDVTTGGTWISNNTSLANVSTSGVVSGIIPGSLLIQYSLSNACGADTTSFSFVVKDSTLCREGINNIQKDEFAGISIYPNPNTGSFSVKMLNITNVMSICLMDIYGKTIETKYYTNGTTNEVVFDLKNLASGAYIIAVNAGEKIYREKMMILNSK